jgi:pyridoxamine 5'-phosphate oxidase
MVLLKAFDSRGFVVFTNYGSRKATELEANPRAALTFFWPATGRQVRIEGLTVRTSREESLAYFASRPYESRLGAWASNQSAPLPCREELEERFEQFRARYPEGHPVPLPGHWGGYRIKPVNIEFWQQGPFRLHDRFLYGIEKGRWRVQILSP